jgi:hypothetical protein
VIDLEGEALVVDEAREAVHHVDGVGALVLPWLDGTSSVEALSADVAAAFGVDTTAVGKQLTAFVERLEVHGLLTTSELPPIETAPSPAYLRDPPAP